MTLGAIFFLKATFYLANTECDIRASIILIINTFKIMNHTHQHHKGLQCSCCSPLWKGLLSDLKINNEIVNEVKETRSEPLIFRTGINPLTPTDLRKGFIQTLEKGEDVLVEAIGIAKGRIVATGTYEEVKKQMPNGIPERIIYGGQTILPGFIEPHMHILPTAVMDMAIDVGPFIGQYLRTNIALENGKPQEVYNKEWILDTLRNQVPKTVTDVKNQWIFGRNVDPSLMVGVDKEFDVTALDSVSKTFPIFVINSSMHLAYINQVAIDIAKENGIGNVSDDGILKEFVEMLPIMELLPKPDQKQLNDKVHNLFKTASSRGLTY